MQQERIVFNGICAYEAAVGARVEHFGLNSKITRFKKARGGTPTQNAVRFAFEEKTIWSDSAHGRERWTRKGIGATANREANEGILGAFAPAELVVPPRWRSSPLIRRPATTSKHSLAMHSLAR